MPLQVGLDQHLSSVGEVFSILQASVAAGLRYGCLTAECCVYGAAAGFNY